MESTFYFKNTSDKSSSIVLNDILNKTENKKKELKLNKEERERCVKKYCLEMYKRIMSAVKDPKADKELNVKKLSTMIDFIQVFTTFGDIPADWILKRNFKGLEGRE